MTNYSEYQTNDVVGGTRIEMLLRLYRETLKSISDAEKLQSQPASADYHAEVRRARKLTLGLLAGIDRENELGEQQYRLLIYVIDRLNTDRLEDAGQVLRTLQSGFEEIKDDAIAMELRGEIPSMNADSDTVVMDCHA